MDSVGVAAVVLAGGRGSRLGGVRKADLEVGGRRLLDIVLDSLGGCAPIVVVGDADLVVPEGVAITREDPPFAGPAAALGAGLTALDARPPADAPEPGWVLCVGCDQPGVSGAVPALCAATSVETSFDAFWASNGSGDRIEWVLSVIRSSALRRAIAEAGGPTGLVDTSMQRLLGGLRWAPVVVPANATDDIDTWEDHARWLSAPEQT